MEAKLIEAAWEVFDPDFYHASSGNNQLYGAHFGPLKNKSNFSVENRIFTVYSCLLIFIQKRKFEFVIDFGVEVSWIFWCGITDECNISVSENNFNSLCEISIKIKVALKAKLIGMYGLHDFLIHGLENLPYGTVDSLVHFSNELAKHTKII